ncbi:MAG: 3'(2'),5'-bisphosphate nucleotidase CysQ [Carboxylicivirga sp.]|jgi:3'(2'), 5'-bisphosphate nucleotidase|nr:3'(2'),5'-bisphosphate nucleotidase CysQ [Carboxylicivirga sp.]
MNKQLLPIAIEASLIAGKEIMTIFNSSDFGVRLKSDDSPLTEADIKSHQIIEKHLMATHIPVLSEEGIELDYEERKQWSQLWIVDPLDGTKEFVKRSGEFTVNIALVDQQKAVKGVVFAPCLNLLYWGDQNGAYKAQLPNNWREYDLKQLMSELKEERLPKTLPGVFSVVASVSHFSKETEAYVNELKNKVSDVQLVSRGSSLKMCLVAEGSAHLYPRLGPTMEWDTAAGQAILEAVGGKLFDWQTKQSMKYNRKELLNGWFLAVANGLNIEDYFLL